jgi:integrase
LKAAFNQAVKWELIPKNPFKEVKQIKVKYANIPKFLSKEEIKKLLDTIPAGQFRDLILFYIYTGCRRDEALDLTWNDIDLQRGAVRFVKTKSGERVLACNPDYRSPKKLKMDKKEERGKKLSS